ncbi:hypothetical protein SteCoe_17875 [Stentor coeruleus]|uniref:Uncharacterized protein n=1 Tax=Stentor coeruleus TaxID=5963 RepID=A0A1R2BXY3_9CILI|nr:hypothetical protein SteCoe_17875 [Stentor coeruleus]
MQEKSLSARDKIAISKSRTLIDEYISKCGKEINLPERLSTIREFGKRHLSVREPINIPNSPLCPLSPDPLRFEKQKKIKALEEIGMFSEYANSKKVFDWRNIELTEKQGTIHVTDFMSKNDKMKIFRIAGDWQTYESRKNKYKLELQTQKIAAKNLFSHSELPPLNHSTPYVSLRYIKDSKHTLDKKDKQGSISLSSKSLKINQIIEQCEQAINKSSGKRLSLNKNLH